MRKIARAAWKTCAGLVCSVLFLVANKDSLPQAEKHVGFKGSLFHIVVSAVDELSMEVSEFMSGPEVYMDKRRRGSHPKLGGNRPSHRPYLTFFAGQTHGRVRLVLLEFWKDKDPDLRIYILGICQSVLYDFQHMKFCICAMGYKANSPRLVEAISYDPVPVIIADNFWLPSGYVLVWSAFPIPVDEKDVPNFHDILLKITDKQYRSLQSRPAPARQATLRVQKSEFL